MYTDGLEDVIEWLGALIRAIDATLLDEWALLAGKPVHEHVAPEAPVIGPPGPPPAWRTAMRTAAFGWVELLARRSWAALADRTGWGSERLIEVMTPYSHASTRSASTPTPARSPTSRSPPSSPAGGWSPSSWPTRRATASGASSRRSTFAASADEGAPLMVLQQLGPLPRAGAGEGGASLATDPVD